MATNQSHRTHFGVSQQSSVQLVWRHRRRRGERMGTSIVEAAFVLPVFLLFVFAIFEFGHAQMVANGLKAATRAGARLGSTEGISTDQAEQRVRDIIAAVVEPSLVDVMIRDGSGFDTGAATPTGSGAVAALPGIELMNADPRQMFVVRADVSYNDVAILPLSWLEGVSLSGQAVMRHE